MTPQLFETLAQHAGLVVSVAVVYWWLTPRLIRSALQNGSGDVVRRIIKEENAEQSRATAEAIGAVRERLIALEVRLLDQPGRGQPHYRSPSPRRPPAPR